MSVVEGDVSSVLCKLKYAVKLTTLTLNDFVSLIEDNIDDSDINKCINEFVELSSNYVTVVEKLSSAYTAKISWISECCLQTDSQGPSQQMEMEYADGDSPWSFWLKYKESSQVDELLASLQRDCDEGKLRKISESPGVGSSVICVDRRGVFRALVLSSIGDKVRVRNVDKPYVKVVRWEDIHVMPKSASHTHAQTVQCCLTEDESLRELWNTDLCELLKNTVRECRLSVEFVSESGDKEYCPPKYLIKMKSIGGDVCVNFNSWICDKLFVELSKYKDDGSDFILERLPHRVLDPYYTDRDEASIQRDLNSLVPITTWSPQLMLQSNDHLLTQAHYYRPSSYLVTPVLPHHPVTMMAHVTRTTAVYPGESLDSNANYTLPCPLTTAATAFIDVNKKTPSTLNAQSPPFVMQKSRIIEKKCITTGEDDVSSTFDNNEVCEEFNKKGFCLVDRCLKKHVKISAKLHQNINSTSVKSGIRSLSVSSI